MHLKTLLLNIIEITPGKSAFELAKITTFKPASITTYLHKMHQDGLVSREKSKVQRKSGWYPYEYYPARAREPKKI